MSTWLDVADKICSNCVRECGDYAGSGNCPHSEQFKRLEALFNMRDALNVLWENLSFDDPLCAPLLPIDEKICGEYEELYSGLMKTVENDFDDGMFAGISPSDDGDYPEQCCHWD